MHLDSIIIPITLSQVEKMNENPGILLTDLHTKFFSRFLRNASAKLTAYEPTRPTFLFFMVSGLDMLKTLNDILTEKEKSQFCDWIYSQQIQPRSGYENDIDELRRCGFYGSRTLTFDRSENETTVNLTAGHLAMTYSSLCLLLILDDDLSRVNRTAILKSIKFLQNDDGSFLSSLVCGEKDMRFIYCAVVICYILNDFSFIDVDKAVEFIVRSTHYDGGIALEANLESHGGSSFCGIAALSLLGRLPSAFSYHQIKHLERWLIMRHNSGFQGRPNKEVDTCYSFWIGAALQMLGIFSYVDWEANRKSIFACQKDCGGFSKHYNTDPDFMHTYFALYGLSLMKEPGLREMHPALNMSMRVYERLKKIHNSWSSTDT